MPNLQGTNDTAIGDYIQCDRRNGRMHYRICDKCKHIKKCSSFKLFRSQRVDLYPTIKSNKK